MRDLKIVIIFICMLAYLAHPASCEDEKVFTSGHESIVGKDASYVPPAAPASKPEITDGNESIIGRSEKYIPPSANLSTLTVYLDPVNSKSSNIDKAAELCMSIEGVKSAVMDKVRPILTLSVDGHATSTSSVEAIAENVKSALKRKLDVAVIESRVLN